MNEPAMPVWPLFQPPVFSPRAACALNALLRCADHNGVLPWPEEDGTRGSNARRARLRVQAFPQPFTPTVQGTLYWFGGLWTVAVGGLDVTRVHPLLKDVPAGAAIPEALRLAGLDMLVRAMLEALGTLGGAPESRAYDFADPEVLAASGAGTTAQADPAAPCLWLELGLPEGPRFPVCVGLPENDAPVQAMLAAAGAAARTLCRREAAPGEPCCGDVAAEPRRGSPGSLGVLGSLGSLGSLAVAVGVEAGAMRLGPEVCRGLAVGDILLPDDYPAREHRVRLIFAARCPMPVPHCAVNGRVATIEHLTLPPEASMSDSTHQAQPEDAAPLTPARSETDAHTGAYTGAHAAPHAAVPPEAQAVPTPMAAAAPGIPVPEMDLAVSFELERRLMTVADVAALRPGHTFTLTTDPLAPVTVRVQGKAIGTGRLVDLHGTLGVQITALS